MFTVQYVHIKVYTLFGLRLRRMEKKFDQRAFSGRAREGLNWNIIFFLQNGVFICVC